MLAERVRRRLQPAAAMAGKVGMVTARQEAAQLLVDVGTRFAHSEAVASQAVVAGPLLDQIWRSALIDAAWLHESATPRLSGAPAFILWTGHGG